jgi:L-fucose isomerase-like protein
MNIKLKQPVLGVIYGNRDFFPDQLVTEARADLAKVFAKFGIKAIQLGESAIPSSAVLRRITMRASAPNCSANTREKLMACSSCLPNFGDEKGVADTLKMSKLNVPVLIQGYPDDLKQLSPARRRDAFCGKISVTNNLVQAGIKFSLTSKHVSHPTSASFEVDLQKFLGVCRVVNGVRGVRLGAVGARDPALSTPFVTRKRFSNATASASRPLTSPKSSAKPTNLDAIRPIRRSQAQRNHRLRPRARRADPTSSCKWPRWAWCSPIGWMPTHLDATAIQCWTSVQENYGCNVCTLMSMMSEKFMPSACEVDVTGVLTMHAMQLAGCTPAALVDWNNNYADDDDKCVLFHCGNWAKSFLPDIKISTAPILGSILGVENTYGALDGRTPAGPLTYGRITTADAEGKIRCYVGEGELTNDKLETFGNRAVAKVPNLQGVLRHVCEKGFEHHVVMTQSHSAEILAEAFGNYFGWEVHHHK